MKKNPPRAQIFRYFRIESRNNEPLISERASYKDYSCQKGETSVIFYN